MPTQLENYYLSVESERRLYVRRYDRELAAFIAKWFNSGKTDNSYKTDAVRMASAALTAKDYLKYTGFSASLLANQITNDGSKDSINSDIKDACLHFAQLGYLNPHSDDSVIAASILLNEFAVKILSWPIWNPYYETYANRTANNPLVKASYQSEYSAGIWGKWIYEDLVLALPLLEAWVLIRDHPSCLAEKSKMLTMFERFKNVIKWREEGYNNQPDYSNQDAFTIRGKIHFGLLLPDYDYLHEGIRHLKNLYRNMFYRDGWWYECAPAYHGDLLGGLKWLSDDFPLSYTDLQYYTNSVDGKRYDGESISNLMKTYYDLASSVSSYRFPNGYNIAVGDSIYNIPDHLSSRTSASNPVPPRLTPASSRLFGSVGQGTLCLGGTGNETMVTLHYGPYSSHSHRDTLNLNVWSKGQEVISETEYRGVGNTTREWNTSTPAHVTVTVNKINQFPTGSYANNRRLSTTSPLDTIKERPDWQWRWALSQAATDHGKLRLFNTEFDSVKVIEADGPSAYDGVVSGITKYRRTVALVKIDDNDCYVADIFRIKGGTSYDYMLHSCLHQPHTAAFTISPSMETYSGKLYTSGTSTEGLDKPDRVKGATTDSGWSVVFTPTLASEKWILNSYVLGATATNVIEAQAPAMRIVGNAPFVCARRDASESVYIAVHHPINKTGTAKVQSVSSLTGTSTDVVAFKVVLTNGRTDTIMSGESLTSNSLVDGRINFMGSFGHLTETASPTGNNQWLYLVDGSTLKVGTKSITGNVSVTGSINDIINLETRSYFNTVTTFSGATGLNNYTLLIDPAGLPAQGYKIEALDVTGPTYSIITSENSGLVIASDATGQYVKQQSFPSWGQYGSVSFKIPGSARLVRGSSGVWNFNGVGSATGTTI